MNVRDRITAALKARADVNRDGKVSKADVDLVMNRMSDLLKEEANDRPWGVIVGASVLSALLAVAITKLFFC